MKRLGFLFAIGFCLMGFVNRAKHWYDVLGWAIIGGLACVGFFGERGAPRAPVSAPRKFLERAYLVVHIDLNVSPPVAKFVCTYSTKASDLTLVGTNEARADLYMVEAETFQGALDEMERIQPLYFPWATPLMTRNR